jgi:7-keto-8-aminopelargonate synthetase-like enzyme
MNCGVIAALVGPEDLVISDQWNHASLIDGCRLSGAPKRIYPHADTRFVRKILEHDRARYRRAVLITESVFSMDGDIGPLAELSDLCQQAHATGVLGTTGGGLGEQMNATNQWLAKLGTFSKAVGTCGGFVAGSDWLVKYLINRCRSYVYSTAIAPPVVAATLASIQLMPELSDRRERLELLSSRVRAALQQQGWRVSDGHTPIVPVILGDSEKCLRVSQQLAELGCYVPAIRPPTVPIDTARLRISLSSAHADHHIDQLLKAFEKVSPTA